MSKYECRKDTWSALWKSIRRETKKTIIWGGGSRKVIIKRGCAVTAGRSDWRRNLASHESWGADSKTVRHRYGICQKEDFFHTAVFPHVFLSCGSFCHQILWKPKSKWEKGPLGTMKRNRENTISSSGPPKSTDGQTWGGGRRYKKMYPCMPTMFLAHFPYASTTYHC